MKIKLYIILATLFIMLTNADAVLIDRIVAVVNNDIITQTELNEIYKPYSQRIKRSGHDSEEEQKMLDSLEKQILDKLIDDKLTDEQIREASISIEEKEINEEIDRIKDQQLFNDEEFEEALKKQGTNFFEYRQKIKEQILRFKLYHIKIKSKIVITENDIRAYYDSHPEKYQPKQKYHLRSIVKTDLTETVKDNLKEVLQKLGEGQSFSDLAKIYSDSSLASEGGDLGLFALDELSETIRDAVKELKDNESTSILETDVGYQIIYVEKILLDGGKKPEEVNDEIKEILFNEVLEKKYKAWLKNIRDKSYIKIIN